MRIGDIGALLIEYRGAERRQDWWNRGRLVDGVCCIDVYHRTVVRVVTRYFRSKDISNFHSW